MSGGISAATVGWLAAGAVGAMAISSMMAPDMPSAPTPPAAPSAGSSGTIMDTSAQEQAAAMQRGRTSTMLTGGSGLSNMGETTSKQLLGS